MTDVAQIWSYLSTQPLLWLTSTITAYIAADWVAQRLGRPPLANPVLIAVLLLAPAIWVTGTPYDAYFEGAKFIHFLLGPATIALAVPLYANLSTIRRTAIPIIAALAAGSTAAAVSTVLLARSLDLPMQVIISISPKSTTAPVALGISEALGGLPTLTAVLVILTGVIGAIAITPMMNMMGVTDWRARGLAAGVAAHGIGTARAFQVNETAGAFAGIGMALNAVFTSIIVPIVVAALL